MRIENHHPGYDFPAYRLREVLKHVMASERVRPGELALILADHETVLALNRRYLGHDYHTDVLAFDLAEERQTAARHDSGKVIHGEIYVDLDTAHERCTEFGVDAVDEALRYAVHGLLHLIGHSDRTASEKSRMHALEDRYLKGMRP